MNWRDIVRGCLSFLRNNSLSISMLVAIVLGFMLGLILRRLTSYTNREVMYIGFLGELFLQMLKGVAMPLVSSRIILAFTTLDRRLAKIFGIQLTLFIIFTKLIAAVVGIAFVMIIKPGVSDKKDLQDVSRPGPNVKRNTIDTFLDMIRNIFPQNMIDMTMRQSVTNITKDFQGKELYSEVMIDSVNMLGLVTFSIVAGLVLKTMGDISKPIVEVVKIFDAIIFVILNFIMIMAPILLISLVAQQVVAADPHKFLSSIGWFVITSSSALLSHFLIVYPLIIFFLGARNPFKIYWEFFEAITTSFAGSSSMATLPIAMDILQRKCGYDPNLVSFIVPVAITINKDGSCLNLVVCSIFFAQYDNMNLDASKLFLIIIFSLTLSIASPGVPQGVLLMLVVLLESLGLPENYAGNILAVDLLVDRIVAMVNVGGSCVAVSVINNFTSKKRELLNQEGEALQKI